MDIVRKRKSTVIWVFFVILLICALTSLAVLFSRMSLFSSKTELGDLIPLTRSANGTKVTALAGPEMTSGSQAQYIDPGFAAYDENTVWASETQVDIFRLTYENGSGVITVNSSDDDKVIAPGTSEEYVFTLENTGNVPLDYTMSMEAWVEGTDLRLPVTASVRDYTGRYLLGSPSGSEDVLELNTVKDSGVLGAGRLYVYTLEWEWPFEQGIDEYDAMLGNMAVDTDLALTVKINTLAVYDDDPDDPKISSAGMSSPKTGDNMPIVPIAALLVTAIVTAAVSCLAKRRQDEE